MFYIFIYIYNYNLEDCGAANFNTLGIGDLSHFTMCDTTPPKVHPDAWENLRKELLRAAMTGTLHIADQHRVTLAPCEKNEVQVQVVTLAEWLRRGGQRVRMCDPQCWPTVPPRSPVGNGEPPAKMPKWV